MSSFPCPHCGKEIEVVAPDEPPEKRNWRAWAWVLFWVLVGVACLVAGYVE